MTRLTRPENAAPSRRRTRAYQGARPGFHGRRLSFRVQPPPSAERRSSGRDGTILPHPAQHFRLGLLALLAASVVLLGLLGCRFLLRGSSVRPWLPFWCRPWRTLSAEPSSGLAPAASWRGFEKARARRRASRLRARAPSAGWRWSSPSRHIGAETAGLDDDRRSRSSDPRRAGGRDRRRPGGIYRRRSPSRR